MDGQLQNTCNPTGHTGSISSQTNLYIGYHRDSSAWYFNGTLDEIGLYGRTLSSDEVAGMYIKGWRTGYWEFVNGNYNDTCGNANNGAAYGTPALVSGVHNQALNFDLSNYIQVPNSGTLNFGTGNFSFTGWFKTSSANLVNTILDKRETPYGGAGYHVCLYSGGHLLLQISDASGFVNFWSANSPVYNDGLWHFVAFTVERNNPSGVKVYIDGQLQATYDPTGHQGSIDSQADLFIAHHKDSSEYNFDGDLDEISLFGRVLTTGEVARLYLENL